MGIKEGDGIKMGVNRNSEEGMGNVRDMDLGSTTASL